MMTTHYFGEYMYNLQKGGFKKKFKLCELPKIKGSYKPFYHVPFPWKGCDSTYCD